MANSHAKAEKVQDEPEIICARKLSEERWELKHKNQVEIRDKKGNDTERTMREPSHVLEMFYSPDYTGVFM